MNSYGFEHLIIKRLNSKYLILKDSKPVSWKILKLCYPGSYRQLL